MIALDSNFFWNWISLKLTKEGEKVKGFKDYTALVISVMALILVILKEFF